MLDHPRNWLTSDVEQLQIKYALLLDHATGLREHMKDIYNATCFDPQIAPDGMTEDVVKAIKDTSNKALIESVSVSRIQYAADIAGYDEWKANEGKVAKDVDSVGPAKYPPGLKGLLLRLANAL